MSMFNPWKALQGLLAGPALQAGVVLSIEDGIATIELPGGGVMQARGQAEVTQTVFFRNGVIEGEGVDLVPQVIDI